MISDSNKPSPHEVLVRASRRVSGTTNDDLTLQVTSLASLVKEKYDYIAATYPSGTQEVYTFKTGGSGGTTVATVTVNYTDATKTSLLNVGVS